MITVDIEPEILAETVQIAGEAASDFELSEPGGFVFDIPSACVEAEDGSPGPVPFSSVISDAQTDALPERDLSEASLTRLVQDYMPLVRHAVKRVVAGATNSSILGYEDMLSCGVQGLIEAYRAYDANRGAKFSTYALPRIRGSILDALRAAHPLPRSLQKVSSDIEKASAGLYTDLGRSPTRPRWASPARP